MRTTLDIDEQLLREAEQQAQREGKSFAALIEEALRSFINTPQSSQLHRADADEGLDANDPFFSALSEIREKGRIGIAKQGLLFDSV